MVRLTLRSAWYLFAYQFVGLLLCCVGLTVLCVAASLAVTLAGIPLLVAAAAVVRWCAEAERGRLRPMTGAPVRGRYREPDRPGLIARAVTRWKDIAIWRDLSYVVGLYLPMAVVGLTVLTLWTCGLAGVALPLWYHFYGHGWFIHTLPQALLAAAVSVPVLVLCSYLVIITARAHAAIAQAMLRPPKDPLAEAKEMLKTPITLAIHN